MLRATGFVGWQVLVGVRPGLKVAWAGGLLLLVFLAANKILGYLQLEVLDTFAGGRSGRPRRAAAWS